MTDAWPAIDSYAFLSDTHTAALVGPDASVDWFCVPQFDGPSVFARLLDRRVGGAFELRLPDLGLPQRRYLGESLVAQSRYVHPSATVTVTDFLAVDFADDSEPTLGAEKVLIRLVRVESGSTELRVRVEPRPDYGSRAATWQAGDGYWTIGEPSLWLTASVPLQPDHDGDSVLTGRFQLTATDTVAFALGYGDAQPRRIDVAAAEEMQRRTERVWQRWSERTDYQGVAAEHVRRSMVVLRGLAFDETGALLAAPTASLPEWIGGQRNWDYRYTWHRDAALLVLALFRLGHHVEGARYLRFLLDTVGHAGDRIEPMVGIRGGREPERVLDHLSGYADSRPVHVGNEAFEQVQLDTYGHVLDAALAYHDLTGQLRPEQWRSLRRHVDAVSRRWHEPDHGIWEIRGPCRQYVNSKVMAWVCLDRGIQLADRLGDEEAPLDRWRQARDEVRQDVLDHGFDSELGSFVQSYGSTALDASLLRIPVVGFLPGDDPRVIGTIDQIRRRLGDGGALIQRYDPKEADDGIGEPEGAMLICSFELVSALVLAGRRDEAREAFDELLRLAGPMGLYAEQASTDGDALGNYPQAFTHLALIEAALNLDDADGQEALHATAQRGSATD